MTNVEFRPPLELAEALDIPPVTDSGPYVKRSSTLETYTKGLERVTVPDALTVQEAMEVFDLWSKDDAIPSGRFSSSPPVGPNVYDDVRVYSTDRRVVLVEIQRVMWQCAGFRLERAVGIVVDMNVSLGYFDRNRLT